MATCFGLNPSISGNSEDKTAGYNAFIYETCGICDSFLWGPTLQNHPYNKMVIVTQK